MTIAPLKLGFTQPEFAEYVKSVAGKYSSFKPIGCVLHNTYLPNLAKVDYYLNNNKWTQAQLVDNWWQSYIRMGWYSGPHLFIFRDKIFVGCPLWERGTHSPSYNSSYFGIEMIGDYSTEILPDDIKSNATFAIASLFKFKIKMPAKAWTFRYHGEDPRTSHKGCPGKNVGLKTDWITNINDKYNTLV